MSDELLVKLIEAINNGKYDFSVSGPTDATDEEKTYLQFVAFNRETSLRNNVEEIVGATHLPLFAKHTLWNSVWRTARMAGLDAKQTFAMYKAAAETALKCLDDGFEDGSQKAMGEIIRRDHEYVMTKDIKHLQAITEYGDIEDNDDLEDNEIEDGFGLLH